MLELRNVSVFSGDKEIIKNVSLKIKRGEIHVLVGPNGSGKSTLAKAIMGIGDFKVNGKILLDGKEISKFPPEKRAEKGIFLGFQNTPPIEGVSMKMLFYHLSQKFRTKFNAEEFGVNDIIHRDNSDFSGGEKKKYELIQMIGMKPKYAIMDEMDSGMDVDSLEKALQIIKSMKKTGFLLITHRTKKFRNIEPDRVHVMVKGRIICSSGPSVLEKVEKKGFGGFDDRC